MQKQREFVVLIWKGDSGMTVTSRYCVCKLPQWNRKTYPRCKTYRWSLDLLQEVIKVSAKSVEKEFHTIQCQSLSDRTVISSCLWAPNIQVLTVVQVNCTWKTHKLGIRNTAAFFFKYLWIIFWEMKYFIQDIYCFWRSKHTRRLCSLSASNVVEEN